MLDKNNENTDNTVKNNGGTIEFSFGTPKNVNSTKTTFVFGDKGDADKEKAEVCKPHSDTEKKSDGIDNQNDVKEGEFIVPDEFDTSSDYSSAIWRPYVPRFTDATKDRYYFADNSAADKKREEAELRRAQEEALSDEEFGKSPISVVKIGEGESSSNINFNDPTAEVESCVPDVVVVNIKGNKTEPANTINIFKFPEENEKEEKTNIDGDFDAEEKERHEISGLTGHKWESEAVSAVKESEFSEENAEENVEKYSSENPIGISSAEPEKLSNTEHQVYPPIQEYDKVARDYRYSHVPEGYDNNKNAPANDTSEYNSFSMRDTFKDKFLDSIMAARIRLAVAVLLGLCSLLFSIFEAQICAYFDIYNAIAPAVIDGCLIISLALISIPESVIAIKKLIRGSVMPELSVAFGGIALLGYTAAIAAMAPLEYPLFSCVYSVIVINSIFATNYLHNAHFSAFKVVSEKGNKQIIDKPYTRKLELENIALDGAVDEYKSKTASLYTTPFVSGFFGNISKSSENSKNNTIILTSTFGVSVVTGLIVWLISGPVAALAAFALVVSLSLPAFSILSHKLPYKDVQDRVKFEKSAVIGEYALYDYSDIDVVTFEDTEVFGPDDVTLKSASDRRSDYVDTMRKMASLFAALGGPLCRVFESALNKKYSPAENVKIEDDGVEGVVDGKRVMAGNSKYMIRHGIKIPSADDKKAGSTRIIYAASDGEFFATFTVHYSFSEEFALELSALRENGIVPLVYTRDFNIDNEFMQMLTGGNDVIRVMKKYTPVTEAEIYSKINATMVTFGGKTAAINLILSAKRYSKFKSLMAVTELTACLTGAALAVAIALTNMAVALPAALLVVWQLGWSVVLAVMSKRIFNHRGKEKNYD